jgi:hypothetical protein
MRELDNVSTLLDSTLCFLLILSLRVRVQEAVRGTETKKIPLSFDYCIAAQLKNASVDTEITGNDTSSQVNAI